MFKKASNAQKKIKLGLSGASGSGKTMTAIKIATNLETPVALIDTERGSANVYGDLFNYDICELDFFSPQKYIEAINYAVNNGYKTIIIDSLSHCYYWSLDEVNKSNNSFQGWAKVRPLERALLDCMLKADAHIICTMRSKTEWVMEQDNRGRNIPKKIGTTPVQNKDIEYEFDIFGELTQDNILRITKTRCPQLNNRSFPFAGDEIANILKKWTKENSSESLVFVKSNKKVDSSQLKKLYETAEDLGLSNSEAKAIIQNYGYESSLDILLDDYQAIIEEIKTAKIY